MRGFIVVLLLVFSVSLSGQTKPGDRAVFTVGTVKASRGQTATGAIEVPAGSDAAMSIPVVVAHGAKRGPVLALLAGAHGTEYASIIALEKLITEIDAAELSGTVIILPLVNVPSFQKIVPHLNPTDGKNMNRMYPGKMDGTQTDRASFLITTQVVEQADHVIDFHGGDIDESLRPYAYWNKTGRTAQDAFSRDLVLAFGLDHIVISADRPKDPNDSRYFENTATTRGKPSLIVEAGHAGTVEADDVAALVNGTLSVMRRLAMLPGAPTPTENPVWIDHLADVAAEQGGIFYPLVKRGAYVNAGMKIGYVTDYVGRLLFEARAKESGVLLYVRAVPSINRGETIASVGVVGKAPVVMATSMVGGQSMGATPPPPLIRENATVKLTDHVWAIPDFNVGLVPNVGIIVGSKATLVVDTGLGPRNGEAIVREMKKVSRNADVFVVTTHYHPEHSLGAGAFTGAKLVMTRMQQQDMTELGKAIQDTFASRTPLTKELLSGVPYPSADLLFDREHRLDLGGVHVRLMWRGPAALHTRGDTMVYVEEDRVLFTGDVVMSQRFLAAQNNSSISTWITALDELTALKPAHVVPSHGKLGDVALIARDRAFLHAVQERVGALKREGKSIDDAVAAVIAEIAPQYPEWGSPNGAGAVARAAYAEAR